jgi:hypothetical protein
MLPLASVANESTNRAVNPLFKWIQLSPLSLEPNTPSPLAAGKQIAANGSYQCVDTVPL